MTAERYEVVWTATARRALDRMPEKAAVACIELVYGPLAENPHRVSRELRLELEGKRSARRGDFRVIGQIDEHARTVTIVAVGHRGDIYRS